VPWTRLAQHAASRSHVYGHQAYRYFSDLTNRAFDSVLKRAATPSLETDRIVSIRLTETTCGVHCRLHWQSRNAGREHQIGGPDIFTFREIGLLAAEVIGLPTH